MIQIGQTLTLGDQEGIVCFDATYNDEYYVNVSIGDDFKIFKVEKDNGDFVFTLEKNEEVLANLFSIWLAEGLDDTNG